MEKYNQLKEELKQLVVSYKQYEQDFRIEQAKYKQYEQDVQIEQAKYNQRIKELKHQLKKESYKYIVCGNCNAKIKISNIDSHCNSMKHIIATLPKKSES